MIFLEIFLSIIIMWVVIALFCFFKSMPDENEVGKKLILPDFTPDIMKFNRKRDIPGTEEYNQRFMPH